VTWKQCVISINESYERFEEGVGLLARAAKHPPDLALFTRTTVDRCHRVLLLSPLAVELAGGALSERWTDCEAPELFEWDLVIGAPEACDRLGLCRPSFGRTPAPSPVIVIGADPRCVDDPDRAGGQTP